VVNVVPTGKYTLLDLLGFPVSRGKVIIAFCIFTVIQVSAFIPAYMQGRPRIFEIILTPVVAPDLPVFDAMIYGQLGGDGVEGEVMLTRPMAAIRAHDRIYVSDTGNNRVQVFDAAGRPLFLFGGRGREQGQFLFPYGLAATVDRLFVADLYAGTIQMFDLEGNFIGYFGEQAASDGLLSGPGALFIAGDRLYVTDINRHRVLVFNLDDGQLLREVGMEEDILAPNGVAVDDNGYIYVSSAGRQRIAVYTPEGRPLRFINGSTDGHGQSVLLNPRGVAVTRDGRILAVSKMTHQIVVFSSDGRVLNTFGGLGADIGQFTFPNGLYLDPAGRLFVTDTLNRRVAAYRL
jgi:sugar lactone lactonase YvrE